MPFENMNANAYDVKSFPGAEYYLGVPFWYYCVSNDTRKGQALFDYLPRDVAESYLIVQLQYTPKNFKFTVFRTIDEFKQWSDALDFKNKSCFETILGEQPQKPHFDIDIKGPDVKQHEGDQLVKELKEAVMNVFPEIKESDFMVFTSHRTGKLSYHVIVNNWYHKNNKQAEQLYRRVMNDIKNPLKSCIDKAVYHSLQEFRLLGHHKYTTDSLNMDIVKKGAYTFEQSLIQFRGKPEELKGKMLRDLMIENLKKPMANKSIDDKTANEAVLMAEKGGWLKGFEYNEIKDGFVLLKRTGASECRICKRTHQAENAFLSIYEQKVYFHCRRADKGSGACIGILGFDTLINDVHGANKLDEPVGLQGLPGWKSTQNQAPPPTVADLAECKMDQARLLIEDYLKFEVPDYCKTQEYNNRWVQPYDLTNKITVEQSNMGTGKTKQIYDLIKVNPNISVLFISVRQSQATDTKKASVVVKIEVINYLDVKDDRDKLNNAQRVIIQAESLGKLKHAAFDLVVLDEITSLMVQMDSKFHKNIFINRLVLQNIVKNAKNVIAMDGRIDMRGLRFLHEFRPKDQILFRRNGYKRCEELKRTFSYVEEAQWSQLLLETVRSNKRVYVCCGSKKKAEFIAEQFKLICSVELFTGETSDKIKNEAFQDIDAYILRKQPQLLITTSTMTVGVDIQAKLGNKHYFDQTFVFGSPNSCCVRDISQQVNRVRHLNDNRVVITSSSPKGGKRGDTEWKIVNDISMANNYADWTESYYLSQLRTQLSEAKIGDDEFTIVGSRNQVVFKPEKFWSKNFIANQLERNLSFNHYRIWIQMEFERQGYTYVHIEPVEFDLTAWLPESKEVKETIFNRKVEQYNEAPVLKSEDDLKAVSKLVEMREADEVAKMTHWKNNVFLSQFSESKGITGEIAVVIKNDKTIMPSMKMAQVLFGGLEYSLINKSERKDNSLVVDTRLTKIKCLRKLMNYLTMGKGLYGQSFTEKVLDSFELRTDIEDHWRSIFSCSKAVGQMDVIKAMFRTIGCVLETEWKSVRVGGTVGKQKKLTIRPEFEWMPELISKLKVPKTKQVVMTIKHGQNGQFGTYTLIDQNKVHEIGQKTVTMIHPVKPQQQKIKLVKHPRS